MHLEKLLSAEIGGYKKPNPLRDLRARGGRYWTNLYSADSTYGTILGAKLFRNFLVDFCNSIMVSSVFDNDVSCTGPVRTVMGSTTK